MQGRIGSGDLEDLGLRGVLEEQERSFVGDFGVLGAVQLGEGDHREICGSKRSDLNLCDLRKGEIYKRK